MNVVERMRPAAGASVSWAVLGVLWAVALLGIASVGLFIVPVALLVTGVVAHFYGGRGLVALPIAAAVTVVALLIPFLASGEEESGGGISVPPSSHG